jgi:hypothetical protein
MTKKVYLVDTENVNSIWKELLPDLTKNDRLLLFYTPNSPHISYPDLGYILKYPDSFEMIECYTGNNGLDFQLVSYLGYLLKTAAKTEYIIVSNDTGYDPAIRFWTDRERSVSRMTSKQLMKKKQSSPAVSPTKEPPAPAAKETDPQAPSAPAKGKQTGQKRKKAPAQSPAPGTDAPASPQKKRSQKPAPQQEPKAAHPSEAQEEASQPPVPPADIPTPEVHAAAQEAHPVAQEPRATAQEAKAPVPPMLPPPASPAPPPEEPQSPEGLIQNALGKDCAPADSDWILQMLGQYNANQFSKIHSELQRKFGADQGLVYYKRIRTVLRKFYSLKSAARRKTTEPRESSAAAQ